MHNKRKTKSRSNASSGKFMQPPTAHSPVHDRLQQLYLNGGTMRRRTGIRQVGDEDRGMGDG